MNEVVRQRVIEKINKGISDRDSLGSKYELLEVMKKNTEVIKYLDLVDDIKRIENEIERYRDIRNGVVNDSLEKRISREFELESFLVRGSCSHNIWVYAGSFYRYINHKNEEDYARYYGEDFGDCFNEFSYNKYVCLECNKIVTVEDYKKFEREHVVLKKTGKYDSIDIDYYRGLYYQMLYYNYDFNEALELIIKEFNLVDLEGKKSTFVLRRIKNN